MMFYKEKIILSEDERIILTQRRYSKNSDNAKKQIYENLIIEPKDELFRFFSIPNNSKELIKIEPSFLTPKGTPRKYKPSKLKKYLLENHLDTELNENITRNDKKSKRSKSYTEKSKKIIKLPPILKNTIIHGNWKDSPHLKVEGIEGKISDFIGKSMINTPNRIRKIMYDEEIKKRNEILALLRFIEKNK